MHWFNRLKNNEQRFVPPGSKKTPGPVIKVKNKICTVLLVKQNYMYCDKINFENVLLDGK